MIVRVASYVLAFAGMLLPATASYAQCVDGSQTAIPNVKDITVSVSSGMARVGEPLEISWSLPLAKKPASQIAYLMVLIPEASRLEGKGFLALAAGSPNPRGVRFGMDRGRAIVPLHGLFAERSGKMLVLPYTAGPVAYDWAVVGSDRCGEWIAAKGTTQTVAIAAGPPRIKLRDEFSEVSPSKIIRSLSGRYALYAFQDHFEVYENSILVLKREGREPTFSPTGRFVVANPPQFPAGVYDIIDLVSERTIGRHQARTVTWSHADSFMYIETTEGQLEIVRTLHGRRSTIEGMIHRNPWDHSEAAVQEDFLIYGVGSRFFFSFEELTCDLSIDRGNVVCAPSPNRDKSEIEVYDLAGRHERKSFANSRSGWSDFVAEFAGQKPDLKAWSVGDRLWVTNNFFPDRVNKIRAKTKAVFQSTGTAVPVREARTIRTPVKRTASRGFMAAEQTGPSSVQIVASKLGMLPHALVPELRPARDRAAIMTIQREIAPLYAPNVARFRDSPEVWHICTFGFPDPASANPDWRPELYLAGPGRDFWRWTGGGETYWLTQTVCTPRSGNDYGFSLLARPGDGLVRTVDLLDEMKAFDAKRLAQDESERFAQHQAKGGRLDGYGSFEQAFAGPPSIVGVSGGRYLTIMTRPVPRIIVFDLASWKVLCGIASPIDGAEAVSVALHADLRHTTQRNRDGSTYTYACPSEDLVLSGVYVDDEFVVMDRHGYFEGSEDAQAYLEIAIPGMRGRHVLTQFTRVLERPGIAADVLAGHGLVSPPAMALPPVLRRAPAAGQDIRLEAQGENELDYIQIYDAGRPTLRVTVGGTSAQVSVPSFAHAVAIAVDRKGLISAPLRLTTEAMRLRKSGRLFALAVGIDRYPILRADLKFAAADAKRIANAVTRSPIYAKATQSVLLDGAASEPAILTAIDRIVAQAEPADTVVLFFAGHGLIDDNGRLRLALSTTDLPNLRSTALSFDTVAERLRGSKARVVVMLDVCHAGLADRATIATNEAAASRLATDSGASMIVLSASKGRQTSEETTAAGGGRFSVAIERIIGSTRKTHDADGNGAIGIDELYRGLKAAVVRESGGRQTPWLSRNLMFGDFDLF